MTRLLTAVAAVSLSASAAHATGAAHGAAAAPAAPAASAARASAAAAPAPATVQTLDKALLPANWGKFEAACKKAHTDENCNFLRSVADYKKQADNAKRGVLADQIMSFYIVPGAKQEVNLPAATAPALQAAMAKAKKTKAYPNNLFAPAETEIQKLMLNQINAGATAAYYKDALPR